MKAVVPAAGRGSRMGEFTKEKPKGLVDIDGDPLLNHVFDRLVDCVDGLVVVIGYRGEQLIDEYGGDYRGVPIEYVWQNERLGLGDALLKAEAHVDDDFVVMNGDNVFEPCASVQEVVRPSMDAVVAVEKVSYETASSTGVLEFDSSGEINGLVEKPGDPPSCVVVTGLYYFSQKVFEALSEVKPSDRGELELTDAVDRMLSMGLDVGTVQLGVWRVNVNTPRDLEKVRRLLDRS